jgi:hypothetical protein
MTNSYDAVINSTLDQDQQALKDLKGKTIADIGFSKDLKVEGGLIIDYWEGKTCESEIKRMVLGFTDLGLWVEWHGKKGVETPANILKKKVAAVLEVIGWDPRKVQLVDKPLERGFSLQYKKKEVLFLGLKDIKAMPDYLRKWFTSPKPKVWYASGKKCKCIYGDLLFWVND